MTVKRAFDIIVSAVGLMLLSPAFLMIATAILLDSSGSVLFRQERVGLKGRSFAIHKFRTMVADAPLKGPQLTSGSDPRITRVGRFLRRSKLDELPQLLDVLAGHMSLVGPRPEVPRYVECYPVEIRSKVLSVRPGITDLASLAYIDESKVLARAADPERAYVEEIMPRKLELAVRYVDERTFWMDIRIIFATLMGIVGLRPRRMVL